MNFHITKISIINRPCWISRNCDRRSIQRSIESRPFGRVFFRDFFFFQIREWRCFEDLNTIFPRRSDSLCFHLESNKPTIVHGHKTQ